MSQHDFNIANQGFPATRADINNALTALASNSSGTSAPSTTYANQFWYDTTNSLLMLRNEADSAWITLAYFDQASSEWEVRTAVVQAVDAGGISLKTDDGTTRVEITDSVAVTGDLTVAGDAKIEVASGGIYTITGTDTATDRTITLPDQNLSFLPPTIQVFTSSGTWTAPAGCRAIEVTVVGGGGGGGGVDGQGSGTAAGAGGGGG